METRNGAAAGDIAVGRFVLQIGEPHGAELREASRAERAHLRPHPAPILDRPRLIRGLVDRRTEIAAIVSALDAGIPVEIIGEPGIGKTALLRHLSHHPRAESFADGIVYLSARQSTRIDLQNRIFEAFYESDTICQPTDAEMRRGLQDKHALILLDEVSLPQKELEQILDTAPRCAFVVATRERRLWGEVRSVSLAGLPVDDAIVLLERALDRQVDAIERGGAASLCTAMGGHPLRILQSAAIARERGIPLDEWERHMTPDGLLAELMRSADEKQRRVMLALAALQGVGVPLLHVSGITEVPDVEPSLMTLVGRGLVVSSRSRYRLADGVADRLRQSEDLNPAVNRAITYFTAWAERYRRSPESLLESAEAVLRVQEQAGEARRWGEVLKLGRLLEGALVLGGRWGMWELSLERCLVAARGIADRSVEASLLHQMGTRAVCLGEVATARRRLRQSASLRESLGENAAAALSRRNLAFVLPPVSDDTGSDVAGSNAASPNAASPNAAGPNAAGPNPAGLNAAGPNESRPPEKPTVLLRPPERAPVVDLPHVPWEGWGSDSLPLRETRDRTDVRHLGRETVAVGTLLAVFLLFGFAGALTYSASVNGLSGSVDGLSARLGGLSARARQVLERETPQSRAGAPRPRQRPGAAGAPAPFHPPAEPGLSGPSAEPTPSGLSDMPVPRRASIRIFTARPGSIATTRPTELCYAVSGAAEARIEPGVGVVDPADTLTCRRVAPARTTTYELTAAGRDGIPVSEQVVIVVR
jgi:hypothetical protein